MTDTSPATATPAAAGPAEVRHDRLADVISAGPEQPWAYGAHQARMLVTGVPAGRTCAGLTAGPGTRIDDHGTAGRYSTADFTVAWDTLAAGGWQLRAAPAATDPALPARIRNQLRLTQTACYAPADPAAGLATAAGGRHLFCTLCLLILINAPALMFPGTPVNAAAAIIGNTFVLLLGAGAYTLAAVITRPDPVPATEPDADPDATAAAAAAAAAELLASAAADQHDITTLTHHASQAAQTETAIRAATPAQLAGDPS